jgi:hypothetical protein
MNKKQRLSDLQVGPIRHPSLPNEFINRVKAFKAILGDVDAMSLEKTLDSFKRDAHPENELLIWERIAGTFHLFLSHNPTNDPAVRRDIYVVLTAASMGHDDWHDISHLTADQIKNLVVNYRGL